MVVHPGFMKESDDFAPPSRRVGIVAVTPVIEFRQNTIVTSARPALKSARRVDSV